MEPLKLSPTLLQSLHQILVDNDARAEDPGVAVQYYSAIIGIIVGQQNARPAEKRDLLEQLAAFSQHVMDDVSQQAAQAEQRQAQAESAYGVWRPGDN